MLYVEQLLNSLKIYPIPFQEFEISPERIQMLRRTSNDEKHQALKKVKSDKKFFEVMAAFINRSARRAWRLHRRIEPAPIGVGFLHPQDLPTEVRPDGDGKQEEDFEES